MFCCLAVYGRVEPLELWFASVVIINRRDVYWSRRRRYHWDLAAMVLAFWPGFAVVMGFFYQVIAGFFFQLRLDTLLRF